MLKFKANGTCGKTSITLPTSLSEITPTYLQNVTNGIEIADNYSLIAVCHKEKLSAFVLACRSNKQQMSTQVVPILASKGKTEQCFISEISIGQKLLIAPSSLELGLHVNIPENNITVSKFMKLIEGDREAHQNAIALNTDVYFMEFKLIPNNEIIGAYSNIKKDFLNPFSIIKEED